MTEKINDIWLKLDKNVNVEQLYEFIQSELSFEKVIQLYRLLEYDINFKQNFNEMGSSDNENL